MKPLDLQINVNEIPDAGVDVAVDLPAEWIAETLLPAYSAHGDGRVTAEVTRMGENAFVRGKVVVPVTFVCSRTLDECEETLSIPFAELFVRNDTKEINLAEADVSSDDLDDEPWAIVGAMMDIEGLIREHIVLAQDPYPRHPSLRGEPALDEDDDTVVDTTPLWSSTADRVDPRWHKLRDVKLKD